jgi:hypothetical protein
MLLEEFPEEIILLFFSFLDWKGYNNFLLCSKLLFEIGSTNLGDKVEKWKISKTHKDHFLYRLFKYTGEPELKYFSYCGSRSDKQRFTSELEKQPYKYAPNNNDDKSKFWIMEETEETRNVPGEVHDFFSKYQPDKKSSKYMMNGDENVCVCGQKIDKLFAIIYKFTGQIFAVGSCCIIFFDKKKRCLTCKKEVKNISFLCIQQECNHIHHHVYFLHHFQNVRLISNSFFFLLQA